VLPVFDLVFINSQYFFPQNKQTKEANLWRFILRDKNDVPENVKSFYQAHAQKKKKERKKKCW